MPFVQQLARLGDDESVDVWVDGINIDGEDSACSRYLRDKKLAFTTLRDPRGRNTDKNYDVRDEGTPLTFVFKPGGEYAGKLSGYTRNYPSKVLDLLGLEMPKNAGNSNTVERADGS